MYLCGKGVRSWRVGSSDRSFMVDPLSCFSFQPVLHDWCICYHVCAVVHIIKNIYVLLEHIINNINNNNSSNSSIVVVVVVVVHIVVVS